MVTSIKGCERLLTVKDLSELIGKPTGWIRENLLKPGILKGKKFGGNSWRVSPDVFREFIRKGETGFKHARASGGHLKVRRKEAVA